MAFPPQGGHDRTAWGESWLTSQRPDPLFNLKRRDPFGKRLGARGPKPVKSTVRVLGSLIGAAAVVVSASAAQAQTAKPKGLDFSVRNEATALTPQGTAKSLKFDTRKGRWGVTLNFDQPQARDATANDVQAGAYFRITPKLRVGGAVALGETEQPAYRKTEPVEGRPRVRLETAFKF